MLKQLRQSDVLTEKNGKEKENGYRCSAATQRKEFIALHS